MIPCVISYYAILKIGAIVVMNNPMYSDRELQHQFNDSGAKVLITLDLFCKRMIDLIPKTGIRQIIYTSIGDYLPFPKNYLFKLVAKKGDLPRMLNLPKIYTDGRIFSSKPLPVRHLSNWILTMLPCINIPEGQPVSQKGPC